MMRAFRRVTTNDGTSRIQWVGIDNSLFRCIFFLLFLQSQIVYGKDVCMACSVFLYMVIEVVCNFQFIPGGTVVLEVFQSLAYTADPDVAFNRFSDFFHFFQAGGE